MAETRDYRQELTDKLIVQLETGTAPWLKPWDAAVGISRMPYNPTTGKEYRGINSLALSMQGHTDPRWATYKQAVAEAWQVRKGEKGTLIEYWKFREEKPAVDDKGAPILDENGKQKTVSYELDKPRLFRAVVFNAGQMDGVPELSKEPRKYDWDPVDRAEKILEASGAKIYNDQNDRAYYSPSSDEIHLPGKGQFPEQGGYYSTALHELGHWTGHESRLGRDLTGKFGTESYAKEELRAELSSYFMADKLGIQHDPGQHASYVKSWIKVLQEDKNEIFRAAKDAEQITEYVMQLDVKRSLEVGGVAVGSSVELTGVSADVVKAMRDVNAARELGPEALAIANTAFEDASEKAYGVRVPANWDGAVQVMAMVERDGVVVPAEQIGTPAEFHGVYARVSNGTHTWLADFETNELAQSMASRLSLVHEALLISAGLPSPVALELTTEKTWLAVPFKDKELAKEAGAKWDKDEKRWFAPTGTALAGVSKWTVRAGQELAPKIAVATIKEPDSAAKTWLAVPFKDKDLARDAGARWDKEAKGWFAPAGADITKLQKWVPTAEVSLVRQDPAKAFGESLKAFGFSMKEDPIMDGARHRVEVVAGNPGNTHGFYVGYLDGRPAGHMKNFKTGEEANWKYEGAELSGNERASLAAQALINKQQRQVKIGELQGEAAEKVQVRWDKAAVMGEGEVTPYLARKGVSAIGVRRDGDNLLIPIRDVDGKIWSVQTVFPEKKEMSPGADPIDKVFTKDGKKEGNFHLIGAIEPGKPIITVEGYATGASVHQATGYAVAVAFDAGNIESVVGALKGKYPTNQIFIGADDDRFPKDGQTVKNAGLSRAIEAATKHDVGVIVPAFSGTGKLTDFNDLHSSEGLSSVKAQVESGVSKAMSVSLAAASELAVERMGVGTNVTQPGKNTRHTGAVIDVSGYHATQSTSLKVATIHEVSNLDTLPAVGKIATIQYKDGQAKVSEKKVEQAKELQR